MEKKLQINNNCIVRDNKIFVDGELCFENEDSKGLKDFAKSAYRNLSPSYNKFFKMDEISKLGFIATEFLLRNHDLSCYESDDISIVLSNSHSTIVTDTNHQNTINDYSNFYPSPSIFVYTLPNIMMGEISIRNKLQGENAFFIVEKFHSELIVNHINRLFLTNKSKAAIGGWVNQTETDYEAFVYFASTNKGESHNSLNVNNLFNKNL
jgi:hypothetical protein